VVRVRTGKPPPEAAFLYLADVARAAVIAAIGQEFAFRFALLCSAGKVKENRGEVICRYPEVST
tara:strand:+ start:120 stop:311 length:192 start_codon:yes stop_codon:yes gene_type:complete